jgi:hypothetical protein
MTEPDRKFEEEIRRALCAASDLIIPSGDGLNKIRERTARRPRALGWFLAYVAHLPRQLVRGGKVAASEVAATAHGYSSLGLVRAAARRWPGQARHVLRTPGIWVRPVLAGATALLLVIAVTLSVPRLRQQVTAQLDSAFGSSSGPSSSGGDTNGGGAQSNGAAPIGSQTTTHMPGRPFLATLPAGSTQCQDQGSSGTVTAGTNVAPANSAGTVSPSVGPSGYVGPEPVSLTCTPSTASTEQATSPPVTSVTTTPVTTPPVAVTTPPTTTTPTSTPTTTPPATTSPATTPPTTTPPATTSPPTTSTSSAGNTPAGGAPTDTPPGG